MRQRLRNVPNTLLHRELWDQLAPSFHVEAFKALPGKGVEGVVNGKEVLVVSPGYLKEQHLVITDERIEQFNAQGKTVVFVMVEGAVVGQSPLPISSGLNRNRQLPPLRRWTFAL